MRIGEREFMSRQESMREAGWQRARADVSRNESDETNNSTALQDDDDREANGARDTGEERCATRAAQVVGALSQPASQLQILGEGACARCRECQDARRS